MHSFHDKPPAKHEGCGGELRKVFHPVGIVFKGSGFYKTDSRSADNKRKTSAGQTASKKESASGTNGASGASGTESSSGASKTPEATKAPEASSKKSSEKSA